MSITVYEVSDLKIIHETSVDFSYRNINKVIHLVQYDKNLPIIAVKLLVANKEYALPEDENIEVNVKVRWGKKDRTFVLKDILGCNEERTKVYFEVDEQMSYFEGECNPILELTIKDTENHTTAVVGSSPISITIDRNPVQEDFGRSSVEFTELQKILEEARTETLNELTEALNELTEDANTSIHEALDEVLAEVLTPSYATAVHESLTSEITATNAFEIKDQSGELIKIEGPNKPVNMMPLREAEATFTNYWNSWYPTDIQWVKGNDYYLRADLRFTLTQLGGAYGRIHILDNFYFILDAYRSQYVGYDFSSGALVTVSNTVTATKTEKRNISLYGSSIAGTTKIVTKNVYLYNIAELKNQGVKNDQGVLFSQLTNEEITEQMDIWFENGWPTKINKIVSKSDNLFDGSFNSLTNLDSEAIIVDGTIPAELTTDDLYYTESDENKTVSNHYYVAGKNLFDKDNITTGYYVGINGYLAAIDDFFVSDYIKVKPNTVYIQSTPSDTAFYDVNKTFISYTTQAIYTTPSNTVYMRLDNPLANLSTFQLEQGTVSTTYEPYVKPKKIVNLSDLIADDILPAGLENNVYLDMIVNQELDTVPLRESNLISVEPGVSYKVIKPSTVESTHKLVEYTTTNELVKVTDIIYTDGKSQVLTMDANTSKVKIVSDLLDRAPNKFNTITGWVEVNGNIAAVGNDELKYTVTTVGMVGSNTNRIEPSPNIIKDISVGDIYYISVYIKGARTDQTAQFTILKGASPWTNIVGITKKAIANQWIFMSNIGTSSFVASNTFVRIAVGTLSTTQIGDVSYIKHPTAYKINNFKDAGVKNDDGILFSRLTNNEIKAQMDIWVKNGFPDHVISSLYPNGADTALSFKYNDADDVFRALESDEMRIDLELRNGEYWENNYVVKQNGNAQYFPLDNTISAWNYGQLEAQYNSGLPTDFHFKYPLNTASQIVATSNYLQEARKQLDYVTNGYNAIAEQLGDMLDEDAYNSIVGITSEKFKYYELDGISTGSRLKIVGTGQSIQNIMRPSEVPTSYTQSGVTISYDSATGIYAVDGTFTNPGAQNFNLLTAFNINLPVGTAAQLMRYYVDGTVDLNGSYIGYVLIGSSASHRINENSESLYDPYINSSGNINAVSNVLYFQVWKQGISFDNFRFKIGIYEGLKLQPFVIPGSTPARSNVTVYTRNENMLDLATSFNVGDETSDIFISYDALSQEFLVTGTATSTRDISLSKSFPAVTGDRFSIKRVYQAGDVKDIGGVLPKIKLTNSALVSVVENTIYEKIADTEESILPTDITFNTGTSQSDSNLDLKLVVTSGQKFVGYRFRLMIHDNSTDIDYVPYEKFEVGTLIVGKNETKELEFEALNYGILEFVAQTETLNLLYGNTLADLSRSTLEYNSGIASPTRKITELDERISLVDGTFKDKVIAIWGDSRESNNPTSDPSGVGDQLDTSWPALLAKKTGATVYNFGLSGGCWTENTVQQDAAAAIVNRISTQDTTASADIIIISCMNDFKLASPLGSSATTNKTKTTFYGAMRTTYETLATKYPGKKILLVLPQKRYDENVNYGGGSYYHYLKAQVEVANEYGISIVDLYHNMPGAKNTSFYTAYMLNDTHWNATGNDRVAELVMKELLGNGNKGSMDTLPSIPTADGTYTLQVTLTGGVPTFSWVSNT